jgi:hypothetical protein
MAIKIQGSTIIDDSRNIVNSGIATLNYQGAAEVTIGSTSVGIGTTNKLTITPQVTQYSVGVGTAEILTLASNVNNQDIFSVTNDTGAISYLTVTNSGFIGIGTTNPSEKLHLEAGNLTVRSGTTEVFYVSQTGNNALSIQNQSSGPALDVTGIGSVGIGTTQPSSLFQVVSAGSELFSVSSASGNLLEIGIGNTDIVVVDTLGDLGIGTTNPTEKLDVTGNIRLRGGLYDFNNNVGAAGSVLTSTGAGVNWSRADRSGTFDTGISTSIYVSVTSGIGTAVTGLTTVQANNDIFIGPGIGYSFPSTAGIEYVIESIHVTNIFSNELYLSARQDYSGGSNVPIAQRVIVPYQGSTELLEQPIIASPQDIFRFQAFDGAGAAAAGVDGGLDAFIVYSTKTDTNYIGTGQTVTSSSGTEIYTSTTYPTVLQSIRLINYNLSIDIDASVSIYRGGTVGGIVTTGVRNGYLAYNLTVPKNSTIEICQKPKYLATNDTIVAVSSPINSLAVCVSGKQVV